MHFHVYQTVMICLLVWLSTCLEQRGVASMFSSLTWNRNYMISVVE